MMTTTTVMSTMAMSKRIVDDRFKDADLILRRTMAVITTKTVKTTMTTKDDDGDDDDDDVSMMGI